MSISSGIIGLPQSGKTTVFNALTAGRADTTSHTEGPAPHIGVARVPEPRLAILQNMFQAKKAVLAEARYIDIGASVKNLAKDKGIGGELLNQLAAVDNLICVVRAFQDDSIPHPRGSLDVPRDIADLDLELVFSDLAIMERRLERLETSLKGARPAERPALLQEKDVLLRLKAGLEADRPIRELELEPAAARLVNNYQFLTAKPLLIAVNIGEEQLDRAAALEAGLNQQYAAGRRRVTALCGKLEMELSQLESVAAAEFRAGFGLEESGLERTIKASYELADLITFLTAGPNEVRAWSIKRGTTAARAAGKIHTDMEKGFIRAETIAFDELVKCGGIAEARRQGVLRLEGKDYVIQDGDVITFLFNV